MQARPERARGLWKTGASGEGGEKIFVHQNPARSEVTVIARGCWQIVDCLIVKITLYY
jgi:hypothetical protein